MYRKLNSLGKHIKKVRSSHSSTELSKTQFFPESLKTNKYINGRAGLSSKNLASNAGVQKKLLLRLEF